jgi:hypothetical protein
VVDAAASGWESIKRVLISLQRYQQMQVIDMYVLVKGIDVPSKREECLFDTFVGLCTRLEESQPKLVG